MKRALPTLFGVLLLCSPAAAETVDTCGQRVAVGELAADLDCSGTTGFAVILEAGGSLDLAGHQIRSGNAPDYGEGGAVLCEGDCTVRNGTLYSDLVPNYPQESRHVPYGVLSPYPLRFIVTLSNVAVTRYAYAAKAHVLRARGVDAFENGGGLIGKRVRVTASSLTDNGQAIAAFRATVRRSEILDNGNGMVVRHAVLRRTTMTGHQQWAVFAADGLKEGTLTASDSTLDDNCLEQGYGDDCRDFSTSSSNPPALENVVCTRSGRFIVSTQTWTTWNVCSED